MLVRELFFDLLEGGLRGTASLKKRWRCRIHAHKFLQELALGGIGKLEQAHPIFGTRLQAPEIFRRSRRAASIQSRSFLSSGRQTTTCAIVCRPSLLWKCRGAPISSFVGERRVQPWALTTRVSQISEKCVPGLRLV